MGQWDIIEVLEKNRGRKMTSMDLRKEFKSCTINKSLEKLRHFGLVNFEIRPVVLKKGIRAVYVYWSKELW